MDEKEKLVNDAHVNENQRLLKKRFDEAIEQLLEKLKEDINVLAVIVSGSVAYDVLWEKSDVDMTVIVRDQQLKTNDLTLVENDVTFNAYVMTRSAFKRGVEYALGGSFFQSYLAKGKMIYSTDDSLYEFYEEIKILGEEDIALTALHIACELISTMHKVEKWVTVRKDLSYAQYFILMAAEQIARMELCLAGKPISRRAIQEAQKLNGEMMKRFYTEPMSHSMTRDELLQAIKYLDDYLVEKLSVFQRPILEYMADGTIKTTNMLADRMRLNSSHFAIEVLDYLYEKRIIEKVTQVIKLTPKSKLSVEEIGFLYIP